MKCKICSSNSTSLVEARILGKHTIRYFRCTSCGFIQTEDPFWLEDAYSEVINYTDIGLVDRNVRLGAISSLLLPSILDPEGKFLDYGGGYGLLVRLMRDAGLDFRHYDKYCENLFARGFEADPWDSTRYEAVTAFEVFEHLTDPIEGILEMLAFSDNILFTTELVNASLPFDTWWYRCPEHGQHISFYTMESLKAVARKLSLRLYSNRKSIHLLTKKRIPNFLFFLLTSHKAAILYHLLFRRKSLLDADYLHVTGKTTG
jgi:hypothetical protein